MAGKGGRRPGAGRPKGSRNKLTRKAVKRAAKAGPLPLDVMLASMRFFHAEAEKRSTTPADRERLRTLAANTAKQAADYIHPKLTSTTLSGPAGGPIQTEDVSDLEVARRIAFLLAQAAQQAGK